MYKMIEQSTPRGNRQKKTRRGLLLLGLMLAAVMPAHAADYVFMYGGGYLAVNNSGAVVYTTDFSRSCVWTCVSNTGTLAAANLGGTSYWLYTEVNGTRYWLVGGTTNGQAVTVTTTAPGTAYWRNSGDYLSYYSSNNYYLYYRGNSWRTSRSSSTTWTNRNNNTYYEGYNGDYRSTITAGTSVAQQVTSSTVSTPTITPSATQTVEYNGSASYTASATGTQTVVPAHTTFTIGGYYGTTYHFYNSQLSTNANDFAVDNPVTPTYTWTLSGDGASALELMSTTGENTIVKYTGSATGTTATLTVTAKVGTETSTASVTINVTPVEPTAISATGTTVYMGNSGEVVYTLTPDYAYNRVNVASGNTGVFTVTSPATTGAVDITPVAAGEATLTLTALNSNGSNGPSTSVTVTVRDICAAPEFSFEQSGSSVVATITCATPGATIRYTTDGTDPTPTTGTAYTGPFPSANGQTIKAIAVKDGYWNPSAVASKTVNPIDYIQQGVSGGIVTLNDLEDHTWTYYSGVSSDLDGGNYNTNYLGKLYSPNPRNVKITYKANGGAVSIDESETQFVYYKTLEESATSGEYAYQVISNPFSKRPNGKGFGGWKITSGADYIKGHSANDVLALDEEIVFNNLSYASTNCVSAEIVFEATWVNLNNITYANNNTITYNVTGGNYETNILVLNRNVTGTITTTSPVTIMMVEPDGSNDYRGTYTFTGNITPNNNGVTKIEFARWNSTNTLNCNNHSVTVGRGMTTTSQCASYVTGVTAGASRYGAKTYNNNLNYHLKLESGTFTNVSFIAGIDGNQAYVNCNGTSNQVKGTLGNDYDRAKGDNTKLTITEQLFLGYRPTYASGNQNNANFTCWVKSGNMGSSINVTNTTFNYNDKPNGGYYGDASQTFYVSIGAAQTYVGKRKLYVEGGILAGIAGGIDQNNNATDETFFIRMTGGTVRGVVYGSGAFAAASGIRRFVITGGTINGWVAAGCNGTDPNQSGGTLPSDTYVYIGGTAHIGNATDLTLNTSSDGNVFGAGSGNAAQATTGRVNNSNVVIADKSYIKNNVFGGGNFGYSNATATLYVTGGEVNGSVFGGSNQKQGNTVSVNMTGGQVNTGIYGGSNVTGTISGNVTMHINGGQVGTTTQSANIHGGGYGSATRVNGNVDLTLGKDCNATSGVTVYGDVYGGSAEGIVNSSSSNHTNVSLYKGIIYGALYGGGLGSNSNPAYVYGPVAVSVFGGSVRTNDGSGENGSGGVFGCNNVNGTPLSTVTVDIYGTDPAPDANSFALFAVYGGGNRSHYTANVPVVTIHGCSNSIEYVYGGGNASNVPGTDVTIWGGHIGNAFGGGNGYSVTGNHGDASAPHYNPGANITASGANLTIHGGTIDAAFGGSNQWGYINGGITVAVEDQDETGSDPCSRPYTVCDKLIVELYGGGNQAPAVDESDVYISPDVTISSCDMKITNLFGGAKNANHGSNINLEVTNGKFENVFGGNNLGGTITGNVTLTLKGGTMVNAFGGNNQGGSITGTITVLVDSTGTECPLKVDNGYGGGNEAAYSPNDATAATPTVNFVNGTVRNAVFGGGLGQAAKITANPTVNIGGTGSKHAIVGGTRIDGTPGVGNVYGGGSQADVLKDGDNTGNTSVTLSGHATVKGNVYGGGNEANVEGNSSVKLKE